MAVWAQSLGNALLFCCIGMVIYFNLQEVWNIFWEERPAFIVPLGFFSFPVPFSVIRMCVVVLGTLGIPLCLYFLSWLPGWISAPVLVVCAFWLTWLVASNLKLHILIACVAWAAPRALLAMIGVKHLRALYVGWTVSSLVLLGVMLLLCW